MGHPELCKRAWSALCTVHSARYSNHTKVVIWYFLGSRLVTLSLTYYISSDGVLLSLIRGRFGVCARVCEQVCKQTPCEVAHLSFSTMTASHTYKLGSRRARCAIPTFQPRIHEFPDGTQAEWMVFLYCPSITYRHWDCGDGGL
jgi:hypothetical protein